jgi:hypothetical protein
MRQEEQELLIAKDFFESIGIRCYDIIHPINCDIYCVKRIDSQWAAYKIGNITPIVPFGKYNHMWGYDAGLCLVSVKDEDPTTFANRGIVDSCGNEIIRPYTYQNIWRFYGESRNEIVAFTEDSIVGLDKRNPLIVINRNPFDYDRTS